MFSTINTSHLENIAVGAQWENDWCYSSIFPVVHEFSADVLTLTSALHYIIYLNFTFPRRKISNHNFWYSVFYDVKDLYSQYTDSNLKL